MRTSNEMEKLGRWLKETCYNNYTPEHCLLLQMHLQNEFIKLDKLYIAGVAKKDE